MSKLRASTPFTRGSKVIARNMLSAIILMILCAASRAYAAESTCSVSQISPGGDVVVTRFLAAPLPRAHEAIADAMQATGVFLFRNSETLVEGERTKERVYALRLPHGDEAIRAELAPLVQDGKAGTQVRVETRRRSNKKGVPEHAWSAAVLDQAACLVSLLSLDDPLTRPKLPSADGIMVRVADSTQLLVRSRHFLFNTDLQTNQMVPFETAEDIVVNGSIVIPVGSLVTASVEQSKDIGEFHGANGQLRFRHVVLPDGTRLPLRGIADFQVKVGFFYGRVIGFAIPAGTSFQAEINGEQEVRISRAAPPPRSTE
jgi:hypothetical protein